MKIDDLVDFLKRHGDMEWCICTQDAVEGVALRHKMWKEPIFIKWKDLKNVSIADTLIALTGGKDVEQITRVTGFFSKVSSWNKGKLAELEDRHKNEDWRD